jgi:hypothetical protein
MIPKGEERGVCLFSIRCPQCFLVQTFAFSVRWSDGSDTIVRRSWDEFRKFQVSDPGANLRLSSPKPPLPPPNKGGKPGTSG